VYLTTGRLLQHYQSGAQTRRIAPLAEAQPEPALEIHPDLAELYELEEGERVRVTSRRGSAEAFVRITDSVRADTVFLPFHWGGRSSANLVTQAALDPVSRMPEFKVCAVRLEPLR
jgi:assimilatory nitrate reductase catalytic subunit